MALMNLLKGNFTGSLGQTYGSSWKDKAVLKSRPFGKAPPTQSQTSAVRAFEAVNRLASQFAKVWWKYFSLSDRSMLRHNAVARAFRPMLQYGQFAPGAFIEVVPPNVNVLLDKPAQAAPGAAVYIKFYVKSGFTFPPGTQLHAIAVDEAGYCGKPYTAPFHEGTIILSPPAPQERPLYVIAFFSFPGESKFFLFGGNALGVNTMQYSLDEQLTGDNWLDGRPIYQKTIDFGNMPTSEGSKAVSHNISNFDFAISFEAVAVAPASVGGSYMLPSGSSSDQCELKITRTDFVIYAASSGWRTGYPVFATIKYIKTA
jgi:hypothetical protein